MRICVEIYVFDIYLIISIYDMYMSYLIIYCNENDTTANQLINLNPLQSIDNLTGKLILPKSGIK